MLIQLDARKPFPLSNASQVQDSNRYRYVHSGNSAREKLFAALDAASGWIAAALMGLLTACVAFLVDISEATISDWKFGYCQRNLLLSRETCCQQSNPSFPVAAAGVRASCADFREWSSNSWSSFAVYGGLALLFATISSSLTMLTRATLPAAAPGIGDDCIYDPRLQRFRPPSQRKIMYMAAGSGIPEIKTFLSGFSIPCLLSFKVLVVKAVGASFATGSGLCLGKEGPFVHISGCIGNLVARQLPRYRGNSRKLREILGASIAAGLCVAFGSPMGGVLFAYEEIATYFPRKTLWRAFLCSAFAAIILKELNPTGTGKLVLFETQYRTTYLWHHYIIFILLGIAGGVWGGTFCKMNFRWSKWFRSRSMIKKHPVFEVFLVAITTVMIQYPNPLTRIGGDKIIRNNLIDCTDTTSTNSWVCLNEAREDGRWDYIGWLAYACVAKLFLTTITFGIKVPSGIIIPALGAGSFFGRLLGQWVGNISPGIFAMVGAGAFLAGVSKMTISLCVVLLELTGGIDYIVPHMVAILVAKWVSDALSQEGIYDLAQTVLGHPFLDSENAVRLVKKQNPAHLLQRLTPPLKTMEEITVRVDKDGKVSRSILEVKLNLLMSRGLLDGGLVLVQDGILQGYLAQGELEFCLRDLGRLYSRDVRIRLVGKRNDIILEQHTSQDEEASPLTSGSSNCGDDFDISSFVDRTPLTICEAAPVELAVECFGKLGLRYLIVLEEGSGRVAGVVLKKRLLAYLEGLH